MDGIAARVRAVHAAAHDLLIRHVGIEVNPGRAVGQSDVDAAAKMALAAWAARAGVEVTGSSPPAGASPSICATCSRSGMHCASSLDAHREPRRPHPG